MLLITRRSEKVKNNLKKYRNTEFNYDNFISHYYIDDDGNAYISIKVESIDDIISRHSIKEYEWINPEFSALIENMANYIPIEEAIVIEICGCRFNDEEKELIKKVLTQHFGLKLGDAIIDVNINKKKAMILLLFGIISLLLFIFLSFTKILPTISELIVFGLWFFLWEYLDVRFLEGSNLTVKRIEAAQLANVKIIFNENSK